MIALRLFKASDLGQQIDMRTVGDGEALTIGRDAAADWALLDPDRSLSRLHMKIAASGGAVTVTDTSTNGVILANRDERMPRNRPIQLEAGEGLKLGPYLLMVEHADDGRAVRSPTPLSSTPFAPVAGDDFRHESRRGVDPFASALPVDPIAPHLAASSIGNGDLGISGQDAWSRRGERHAGDWTPPKPVIDTGEMIGSSPAWREPPKSETSDGAFGFDAPFKRPLMSRAVEQADDLAIPTDWDAPPANAPLLEDAPKPSSAEFDVPADEIILPSLSSEAPIASESAPRATASFVEDASPVTEAPIEASPRTPASEDRRVAASPSASGASYESELFEAFCAGARLDAKAFAQEDLVATMTRLGAMYRHMVLGLSDLMNERTAVRSEYRMIRTTVRAEDNNPFKWAPPQKIATELLRAHNEGFLDGPTAVTESYKDVKKHLLCMLAGLRAALTFTFDSLAPARIEGSVKEPTSILKSKGAASWAEYLVTYERFRKEAEDNADSPVNREFRNAYERQLGELDRSIQR